MWPAVADSFSRVRPLARTQGGLWLQRWTATVGFFRFVFICGSGGSAAWGRQRALCFFYFYEIVCRACDMAHGKATVCISVTITMSPSSAVSIFLSCVVGNTRETLFAMRPDRRRTAKIVYRAIICRVFLDLCRVP